MNTISKLHLEGFKKYKEHTEINFNKDISILIGDNDSGKSSVLQAISIVLKGKYHNINSSTDNTYANLLNADLVRSFENDTKNRHDYTKLPSIKLVVEFELEKVPKNSVFDGENYPQSMKN